MRINARLKNLEKNSRISARCPECDAPLDGTFDPHTKINVSFPSGPIDKSMDFCATCGRQLVLRLEFPKVRSTREG